MAISPEVKNGSGVVEHQVEFPEVPEDVEKKDSINQDQIKSTPNQFQPQVTDDAGNPLTQTPQSQNITITIPKPQDSLEKEAKGSQDDSGTWWAASFLRAIKKAVHFGWRVVTGKGGANGTG